MVADIPTVTVYAGDTLNWPTYTFCDQTQTPRDLVAEGWTNWAAQWRANVEDVDAITLSVDTTDAANGIVKVSASPDQTEAMNGAGVWDLQAINGAVVKTWVRGKTRWVKDVTRVG